MGFAVGPLDVDGKDLGVMQDALDVAVAQQLLDVDHTGAAGQEMSGAGSA